MNGTNVKFYLIVPVYNAGRYLTKCLTSIVSQTYENFEVVVMDDGSEDDSWEILESYSSKDSRFKILRNPFNLGPGLTRNNAIEYVINNHGKNKSLTYVVFIDSDDWIDHDYLEMLTNNIIDNKPEIIFIDVLQEKENGEFIKKQFSSKYENEDKDTIIRHQMTGKLPWGGVRKVVQLNHLISENIRYTNDGIGEEAIYSFKLLHAAEKISFCKNSNYHYVVHGGSQSSSFHENPYGPISTQLKNTLQTLNEYERYSRTHKSFAFTAMIISIYRYVAYYGLIKANNYARVAISNYRNEYGFDIDYDSLENRLKILVPLTKLNLYPVLTVVAYAKNFVSKKID